MYKRTFPRDRWLYASLWLIFIALFTCLLLVSISVQIEPVGANGKSSPADRPAMADTALPATNGITHTVYLPSTIRNWQAPYEVFILGILGPFSGPSARTGDEFKASVNMAFGDIDWQICQYQIEPVWIDSQS
ncbi:MAG: hypothetical protein PVJ26_21960, partial [Anaerolineae bacterium]